ncbi:MAG: MaoC family dehydratase [Candidatus Methylomirabilota bacterium]
MGKRRTRIQDYQPGDRAQFTKTITETDIALFAAVSGDFYPIHFDEPLARRTRFGGRVAHGGIAIGLISTVIGTPLQGPGVCAAVIRELHFEFTAPVRVGDTITAEAVVGETVPERRLVNLAVACRNQRGEVVLTGRAVLSLLKEVAVAGAQ